MYQEWMDAVPLIFEGYYEYNANQYNIAANYWEEHGDLERAKELRNMAIQEINKSVNIEKKSILKKIKEVFII